MKEKQMYSTKSVCTCVFSDKKMRLDFWTDICDKKMLKKTIILYYTVIQLLRDVIVVHP